MTSLVHRLDETPSTQDRLHELAAAGAEAGSAIVARVQTAGRGRRGRAWASPAGGLWLSVLLRPRVAPGLEVLSLRVALATSAVIEESVPGVRLQLKWPNDLLLDGRKLGGILCEARWQGHALGWIAVGVGMNVANRIPAPLAKTAVALDAYAPDIRPEPLATPVAAAIAALTDREGHLDDAELAALRARDWLERKRLREPRPGTACGVARDGALLVRRDDGLLEEVRSGTVVTVDA
jgi:BirA family biotin operon repressor/biotin-[acetyl-CoA-carboxylase] ligase